MAEPGARSIWLIADDYGFSPGVSETIRTLLAAGHLSGTGCMTLFDDWSSEARALAAIGGPFAVGMHLTLTDFPALSTGRTMPNLKRLLASHDAKTIGIEADAQLDRFREAFGQDPEFIDGHQHVHFLPAVRGWLARRFADRSMSERPWLRGSPTLRAVPALVKAKVVVARLLARGFDAEMRRHGFVVEGPLCGFYDWRRPGAFARALDLFMDKAPDGAVVMCHPGTVDDVLRQRDVFTDARHEERDALASDAFPLRLQSASLDLKRAAS
ncbi:ChbG/HpnK family deacetylase [Nitratireductor kimnyeongensis]|uniref:ChbG/HpnK family deacetylase n=1 Tax=Nitratireductor kimnyeongensis TaxID=430679 RepID=A0ABW0T2S1_9HYPH|nr:ChbG/HpnK family deacetylase [Nitratireductor kimnyeongensis]QZZ35288.1 ChbG/HpnK family deacetylase [Nitratireductor kimnyeongensis]